MLLGCLRACFLPPEVKRGGDAQWIEEAGGAVMRDAPAGSPGVDLRATWVTDTDLRKLNHLPYLTHLDLSLTRITDQGMQETQEPAGDRRTESLFCGVRHR